MKRILAIVAVILLLVQSIALAEYNLESMSIDELQVLQSAIEKELSKREKAIEIKQAISTLDYFDDIQRNKDLDAHMRMFDFSAAIADVQAYIDEYAPSEGDHAYDALIYLNGMKDAAEHFDLVMDEFDGTVYLVYPGLNDISPDACIVPYITPEDDSAAKIGYVADDWVFFDTIAISLNQTIIYENEFESYEVENVVENKTVSEWITISPPVFFDDQYKEMMLESSSTVIRFSNTSRGTKYDHRLTDAEMQALYYQFAFTENKLALEHMRDDYSREAMKRDKAIKEVHELLSGAVEDNTVIVPSEPRESIYPLVQIDLPEDFFEENNSLEQYVGQNYLLYVGLAEPHPDDDYIFLTYYSWLSGDRIMLALYPDGLTENDRAILNKGSIYGYVFVTFLGKREDNMKVFYIGSFLPDEIPADTVLPNYIPNIMIQ